ncbi:TPA: serine--tRNA ligase [Candidatus Uhrbacteria bacterium]|uniref:Serine--tRNA ligase n=2 Tax=Candidatus Uhriibacteriota TaxID=1752732 RepID=A0A0G1SFP3_9BACT|nr:MAG: Serine-tRNA ligase [Candidatus Uhrbacteria bacterium GW2011_GWF2_46_218]KKU40903.1 MAG: Serine-tRNA ligase [Candidatus Uhrbacteria bacterium GW2011_GWE2_46_68]HBK33965.1 serine--tRNA ligase [Candidatus Uhrbacteria bacterium]HCB19164.1 serine--tRNA ligase [Candidatus Uhrbacteria bacterium]
MIDPKLLIDAPELVVANNRKRHKNLDIASVSSLSSSRKTLLEKVENLRAKANEIAGRIPKTDANDRPTLIEEGRRIKEEGKILEVELQKIEAEFEAAWRQYPNILREDVPEGTGEEGNQVIRTFGTPPTFPFTPKDHLEIGEKHGWIDMERAAKVSGARFAYLKGEMVELELALLQYTFSTLIKEGFTPVFPPHIIFTKAMGAMGYLEHGGEEEVYHLKNDDTVLIGTSEQAMGPMLTDEMLAEDELPLRFAAFSPCYRREAGSYGKDLRGILRMHQFDKIEMFSFTVPEVSDAEHEFLLGAQEKLMQGLGLPYRVMKLCAGDIGAPSARTYDIETWMPSQNTYRETHSTSNTTDYQTRRLNIRVRREGKNALAHALNGTAFAMGRIMIALIENNQQEDGSVKVPEVLQPWIGKDQIGVK